MNLVDNSGNRACTLILVPELVALECRRSVRVRVFRDFQARFSVESFKLFEA